LNDCTPWHSKQFWVTSKQQIYFMSFGYMIYPLRGHTQAIPITIAQYLLLEGRSQSYPHN